MSLPALVVIFEGTLDRMGMELVIKKMTRGRGGKTKKSPKNILIAQSAKAFYASNDSAYMAMKLLDKRCVQERKLIASVSEEALERKIETMEALIFPNERARMVWALFRDGRERAVQIAQELVKQTLDKLDYENEPQEVIKDPEQAKMLFAQMKNTERRLLQKKEDADDLGKKLEDMETERATLLVKLGQKENQVRAIQAQYLEIQKELRKLKDNDGSDTALSSDVSNEKLQDLVEENRRLRQKVERLQRKLDFSKTDRQGDESEISLKALYSDEKRYREQLEKERDRLQEQLAREMVAAKERTGDLRASLKRARKIAADVKKARDEKSEGTVTLRSGLFVDAANLSASALRVHGGMFDFVSLLKDMSDRYSVGKAIAYIVKQRDADEKQSQSFMGFTKALRHAGYEIKQKTPRERKDGSVKADWDLGIAIDIVTFQQRFDTIIIASGDGDFLPLVQYLQKRQKKVVVAAFKHSASEPLLAAADDVLLLDDSFKVTV